MLKLILAATVAAAIAAPASAVTTYHFSLTGDYTATWSIPATAKPYNFNSVVANFFNLTFAMPGNIDNVYALSVRSDGSGGGIVIYDPNALFILGGAIYSGQGDAIYTGALASPTFKSGAFTLYSPGGQQNGTLTISDTPAGGVPEPASWAMMIVGVGLTGAAMRRRRAGALTA